MKWKNNLLMGVVFSLVVVLFSAKAMAVPNLGIATDGPYYWDGEITDYQRDWTSDFIEISGGQDEGFEVNSGDMLYLWVTSNNNNSSSSYFRSDIYLLAEEDFTDVTFGGVGLDTIVLVPTDGSIASYDTPYTAINLGKVFNASGSLNDDWQLLVDVLPLPSVGYPGLTYVYSGIIEFGLDGVGGDDYFFLAADLSGDGNLYDNGHDAFSPKTSSAVTAVPEPATVALLGIGLVGLAGGAARKKWKKKAVDKG